MNPHKVSPVNSHAETKLLESLEVNLTTPKHQPVNSVNPFKLTLDFLNQNLERLNNIKKKDYLDRGKGNCVQITLATKTH